MRRYLILFLPVLLLLCSCAEEVHYPVTLQNKKKFTKKVKAPLELTRGVARLDYVSGKSGQKILFLLRNKGLSAVNIDEWYMNEPDNIRLYYARCEKGKSAQLKDSDFICVWPEDSKTSKKAAKNMLRLTRKAATTKNPLMIQEVPLMIDTPYHHGRSSNMPTGDQLLLLLQ